MSARKVVEAIFKASGAIWLVRGLVALVQWTHVQTLVARDPVIVRVAQSGMVTAVAALAAGVLLFVLASRIARAIAGNEDDIAMPTGFAVVALRVVAVCIIVYGLISATTSGVTWYAQVSSPAVDDIWRPAERARYDLMRSAVSLVAGVLLFAGSRRIAAFTARPAER